MFYKEDNDTITLKIKVQPNASKSEFAGIYGKDAIKIRVAAPAVEGAANKELIKFISKRFKTTKSNIELISGLNSKLKLIKIPKSSHLIEFIKELDIGR